MFIEDNHLLSFFIHNNIIDYCIGTLIGYNSTKIFFKLKFETFFIALFLYTTPQTAKLKSLLCFSKWRYYYYYYYYYYEKTINDLVIAYIFCYITFKCTYQICNKVGKCSIIPCPVRIFYNSHENELMKRLQGRVKKWSGLSKKLVKSLSS